MTNKAVVMLSGEGNTLQAILDNCENTKVVGVISNNPYASGLRRAELARIDTFGISRKFTDDEFADKLIAIMNALEKRHGQINIIVLAGFMKILQPAFLTFCQEQHIMVINIHPSLLPKYKGMIAKDIYPQVVADGEEKHGMTIHFVTDDVDGGPIIHQQVFFTQGMDAKELEARTKELEQLYYPKIIDALAPL